MQKRQLALTVFGSVLLFQTLAIAGQPARAVQQKIDLQDGMVAYVEEVSSLLGLDESVTIFKIKQLSEAELDEAYQDSLQYCKEYLLDRKAPKSRAALIKRINALKDKSPEERLQALSIAQTAYRVAEKQLCPR